jgi:hypothetical protein
MAQKATRDDAFLSAATIGEIRKGLVMMPQGRRRTELETWFHTGLLIWFRDRILPVTQFVGDRWGVLDGQCQLRETPLNTVYIRVSWHTFLACELPAIGVTEESRYLPAHRAPFGNYFTSPHTARRSRKRFLREQADETLIPTSSALPGFLCRVISTRNEFGLREKTLPSSPR